MTKIININIDSKNVNKILKEHNKKNINIQDIKKNVKQINESLKEIKNINNKKEKDFIESYNNNLKEIFNEINENDNNLSYVASLLLLIKNYIFIGNNYKFSEDISRNYFYKITKEYQDNLNKYLIKMLNSNKRDEFLDILDEFDILY